MATILLGIFLDINLVVRIPVRIALKDNPKNEKLCMIDIGLLLLTGIIFIACIVCALIEGELDSGLAIACIIIFGGAALMIGIPFIIVIIKEFKEKHNKNKHIKSEKPIIKSSLKHPSESATTEIPSTAISTNIPATVNYCRMCGNKLLPDSVFCDKCGTKVMKTTDLKEEKE